MQDFALVEDFSALENVLIPLDFAKKKIKNKKEKALEALKAVGMGIFLRSLATSFREDRSSVLL